MQKCEEREVFYAAVDHSLDSAIKCAPDCTLEGSHKDALSYLHKDALSYLHKDVLSCLCKDAQDGALR